MLTLVELHLSVGPEAVLLVGALLIAGYGVLSSRKLTRRLCRILRAWRKR
ncbi:hypothetical protein PQI51_03305 [Microbacterium esteraromaticum]